MTDLVEFSTAQLEAFRLRVRELVRAGSPRSAASMQAFREMADRSGYVTADPPAAVMRHG
jgi:hypothetical protein